MDFVQPESDSARKYVWSEYNNEKFWILIDVFSKILCEIYFSLFKCTEMGPSGIFANFCKQFYFGTLANLEKNHVHPWFFFQQRYI